MRKKIQENICTIPWGEPVGYIEDVTNGFYKIKYKGQIGYAKAEYLTSQILMSTQAEIRFIIFQSAKFGVFKKNTVQSRRNTFVKFLSERQLNISARTTDMIRFIITVWSDM